MVQGQTHRFAGAPGQYEVGQTHAGGAQRLIPLHRSVARCIQPEQLQRFIGKFILRFLDGFRAFGKQVAAAATRLDVAAL